MIGYIHMVGYIAMIFTFAQTCHKNWYGNNEPYLDDICYGYSKCDHNTYKRGMIYRMDMIQFTGLVHYIGMILWTGLVH